MHNLQDALSEENFLSILTDDIRDNRLTLPTLPEVALRVRELVEDDSASAADVARIIGTDAALSTRLIQVANSPLYRGRTPIDHIQIAVARLGQTIVRNLVTSLVMQQMFQATSAVTDRRLRALWEHSVQVAALSHTLAGLFTSLKPDIALLAGLVHDVGALPILVRAGDMPELLDDEALLDRLVYQLHTHAGRMILEAWSFPTEIVQVVAEHEDLGRTSEGTPDYVDVVQVANVHNRAATDHPLCDVDRAELPAFHKLGLDPDTDIMTMPGVAEGVEEVRRVLRR